VSLLRGTPVPARSSVSLFGRGARPGAPGPAAQSQGPPRTQRINPEFDLPRTSRRPESPKSTCQAHPAAAPTRPCFAPALKPEPIPAPVEGHSAERDMGGR
jgi:hypothetical protein